MSSIYHFFKSLVKQKESFLKIDKLGNFPFDKSLLSCKNIGIFPKRYPEILDDSLNFLVPIYSNEEEKDVIDKFNLVFLKKEQKEFRIFKVKHHFNGYFLVFQTALRITKNFSLQEKNF